MAIAWDPNFETLVDPAKVFPESEAVQYEPVQCGAMYCHDSILPSTIERRCSQHERTSQTTLPFDQMVDSRWFDVSQLMLFFGALIWLTLNGATQMGYNWQWYRLPKYFWRVIDGELIWGPLMDGLFVTLEIGLYGIIITLVIGLTTAIFACPILDWESGCTSLSGGDSPTPLLVQMCVLLCLCSFWRFLDFGLEFSASLFLREPSLQKSSVRVS